MRDQPPAEDVYAALTACHEAAYQWALHCCAGVRADAEDALQESYLRVLERRAQFSGESRFKTWLFSLIWRVASEQRRQLQRRIHRWLSVAPEPVAAQESPERSYLQSEQRAQIDAALAKLSHRQRALIELCCGHALSISESAAVLGLRVGSARTHYARAKVKLSKTLNKEELSYERA